MDTILDVDDPRSVTMDERMVLEIQKLSCYYRLM